MTSDLETCHAGVSSALDNFSLPNSGDMNVVTLRVVQIMPKENPIADNTLSPTLYSNRTCLHGSTATHPLVSNSRKDPIKTVMAYGMQAGLTAMI